MAAKHILDHSLKQEHLRPMLEWHAEIDHQWTLKPGPYGRKLKKHLRPDLWVELERTYTGADLEENGEALFRTVELMGCVASEVGKHLGFTYPHELQRRVLAYLQTVQRLDRNALTLS